jgi:hypothetical protein
VSRWRRQQRKRARSARAVAMVERILTEAKAKIMINLRKQLGLPPIPTAEEISDAAARAYKLRWPEKTTVTVEPGHDERSLKVNVRIENPSPETAEAVLASGGRWV